MKAKNIILLLILIGGISLAFYLHYKNQQELKKHGVNTIGITYEERTGKSTSIRYYFKTPSGLYVGTVAAADGKVPGYYYPVRYSSQNPSVNEMSFDSLIPDSIGKQYIRLNEIDLKNQR